MCVVKRPAINISLACSLVVVPPAPSPVPRVGVEDGDAPGHRARERTISIIAYRSIACHISHVNAQEAEEYHSQVFRQADRLGSY